MFIPQRKNALDNQAIKQAIMNYGAVSASYLSVDEYYSNDQISFCLPDDYDAGRAPAGSAPVISTQHAIAIVGWDDDYAKENFPVRPISGTMDIFIFPITTAFWVCRSSPWHSERFPLITPVTAFISMIL